MGFSYLYGEPNWRIYTWSVPFVNHFWCVVAAVPTARAEHCYFYDNDTSSHGHLHPYSIPLHTGLRIPQIWATTSLGVGPYQCYQKLNQQPSYPSEISGGGSRLVDPHTSRSKAMDALGGSFHLLPPFPSFTNTS